MEYETPNPRNNNWSNLPLDILRSIFERLSFVDFYRAKTVCSSWYSVSKQTIPRKSRSPWLMIFPEDGGCLLYNPDENMVYRKEMDLSGSRFIANCGKWFLMLDNSDSRLYIIDVFNEKNRIDDLPPLERVLSSSKNLKRVGVKEFGLQLTDGSFLETFLTDEIKGRLWVDKKNEVLSLVWFFDSPASSFLCFYKKGNNHYDYISVGSEIPKMLTGLYGLVLRGYRLYIDTTHRFIRVLDFSSQGFKEEIITSPTFSPLVGYNCDFSIAVTRAGEVLFVVRKTLGTFRVYKNDPNEIIDLLVVDPLDDDEAVLLDCGITVPANGTLGIEPNSIYFSRHDRTFFGPCCDFDQILLPCEFNLVTKSFKPFPAPSIMKTLKGAQWIFPLN